MSKPTPSLAERVAAIIAGQSVLVEQAERRLAAAPGTSPPGTDMSPDHPLAKAIGHARAVAIYDTPAHRRSTRAAERCAAIREMSLSGERVKTIAAKLGLSVAYVVQVRAELGVGRIR